MDYLRQVTSTSTLHVASKCQDSIPEAIPRNVLELLLFLRFRNVYRRFVPNIAQLKKKLKKGEP